MMKLTIELERATDTTEEAWTSHCLEIDVVSQGSTSQEAIEMVAEAIDMMVNDEIEAQQNAGNMNPGWERAFANIASEVAERKCARALTCIDCGYTGDPDPDNTLIGWWKQTTRGWVCGNH